MSDDNELTRRAHRLAAAWLFAQSSVADWESELPDLTPREIDAVQGEMLRIRLLLERKGRLRE